MATKCKRDILFTEGKMMKKNEIVIIWKKNKLPCEDCEVIFKYTVELSRLIRVFNNNIWQNQKSVK